MRVVGGRPSRISSLRSEALAFDVIKPARQSARGGSSAIPREYTIALNRPGLALSPGGVYPSTEEAVLSDGLLCRSQRSTCTLERTILWS